MLNRFSSIQQVDDEAKRTVPLAMLILLIF